MFRNVIAAAFLLAIAAPAWPAPAQNPLSELRKSFTLAGKPIPPEVFADFGDSDLADSASIRVTIDLLAAMGSNLYADDIVVSPQGWVSQKKAIAEGSGKRIEETRYKFQGVTHNGLLAVLASFSGGGSGDFVTLHILGAALARGFDGAGKRYGRLDLTIVRSVPLGDRWDGDVKIAGDKIIVVTRRQGTDATDRPPATQIIEAERP